MLFGRKRCTLQPSLAATWAERKWVGGGPTTRREVTIVLIVLLDFRVDRLVAAIAAWLIHYFSPWVNTKRLPIMVDHLVHYLLLPHNPAITRI